MFCPQCGQRQVSNEVRFCSSCGLPLNHVTDLLARGGQLSPPAPAAGVGQFSPRQKGLRQGAMLMASTFLIVPLVALLGVAMLDLPGEIVALAAIVCFMGGLLRLLYALFFEDDNAAAAGPPASQQYMPPAFPPNYLGTPARNSALPPAHAPPAASYNTPRYDTGELANPPRSSVTDHTTRLLGKDREEPQDPR